MVGPAGEVVYSEGKLFAAVKVEHRSIGETANSEVLPVPRHREGTRVVPDEVVRSVRVLIGIYKRITKVRSWVIGPVVFKAWS